jgi:hypothetical protein
VKRLVLLVVGVSLLIVAAPALSLRPYRPAPVDFSIAAPDGGAGLAAPVRAPKRFNMVGVTWRGGGEPEVRVRVRRDGGAWSPWADLATHSEDGPDPGQEGGGAGTSAPLWVGSADWVQYRLGGRVRGARLAFVNTRGDATAADRARNGVRRLANSALLAVAGIARVPGAHAADGRPAMVTRAQWGAADCVPREPAQIGEVRTAFVHHTVSLNDYTAAEAPEVVLGMCRFHRNTNGWNDIGYNFLVDRFGTIYEGRAGGVDRPVIGAQAQGYNRQSTGIANIGTFTATRQAPAALAAIARLIRWKLPLSGAPTAGNATLTSAGGASSLFPAGARVTVPRVAGHRDVDATECPGDALYAQLPELRRLVGSLPAGATLTRVTGRITARGATVTYGKRARVRGTLTAAGDAVARRSVAVEALIGRRWRKVATARTDSRGRFTTLILPRRNRSLRARFAGSGPLLPALSTMFTVRMRPVLSLTRAPRRAAAGVGVTVAGRVRPRLGRVHRVLQRRRGRKWVTVGVKTLKVDRRGRFRGSFRPPRDGSYRYYAEARRTTANALARSRKAALRVNSARGGGVGAP